jgi:hypothetical protein
VQAGDGFERFAGGGFELLGIEADEAELGVMAVAASIYRTPIDALLGADLDPVEPEHELDLSAAPNPTQAGEGGRRP